MKLVYVFDAYCGWSHGFTATLREVATRHPELPVEAVSGGLFTGGRRVPIREFGYVQGANAKIAELTGAEFGEAYERLIADGSFVMDSEAAARGVAALRQVAPDRAAELATALQHAFYVDGLSLSEAATYRKVAEAAGLDADAVVAAFEAPEAQTAAQADFRRAAARGHRLPHPAGRRRRPSSPWPTATPPPTRWTGVSRTSATDPDPPPSKEPRMSTLDFKVLDLDFPVGSKNKTATLVTGESEALLVDAGFTRADGHRLAAEVLDSGKKLTTVFISHADPDFYFGAEVIADAFPDADFVATPTRHRAHPALLRGQAQGVGGPRRQPAHPPGRPRPR